MLRFLVFFFLRFSALFGARTEDKLCFLLLCPFALAAIETQNISLVLWLLRSLSLLNASHTSGVGV